MDKLKRTQQYGVIMMVENNNNNNMIVIWCHVVCGTSHLALQSSLVIVFDDVVVVGHLHYDDEDAFIGSCVRLKWPTAHPIECPASCAHFPTQMMTMCDHIAP